MQQSIVEGMSGQAALEVINGNFTELYGALTFPVKLPGLNANTTYAVPANAFISEIDILATSGAPSVNIGTTPNGTDILDVTQPANFAHAEVEAYYAASAPMYITISGGTISFRMLITLNYF
jgi:hypothetical protein